MTTVTGKFETRIAAEAAAQALIQRGYPAHLISISGEDENSYDIYLQNEQRETSNLLSTYLHPYSVIGAALGGLALGGIAAFYYNIGYLHIAWVFAMFVVGAYVGLLFGTMMPSLNDAPPAPSRLGATSPALIKVCTTPHQSSILDNDLKQAGATQICRHYSV